MKSSSWILLLFIFLGKQIFAQQVNAVLLAEPLFLNSQSILLSENKQNLRDTMLKEKKYLPLTTPKGALFCRMENTLSKKYRINLRIRTGGF